MPVYQIRRLTRPETLRSVCPKSLLLLLKPHAKFLATHGLVLPTAKQANLLDRQGLADILASPDLRTPPELADALYFINEMATRDGSCPRKSYTMRDAAFGERMAVAFDIMAIACIDLRCIWGKLDILHWAIGGARLMATTHQISATFAFMEGEHFGRGQPQMGFFRKRRARPHEPDGHDDKNEDVVPSEPAGPPEQVRFSDVHEGEFATRMMAVEDCMQATTDLTFLSLLGAAGYLVQQLAEVWTAYDRFCHDRLGVSAETMLDAWEFPTGGEVVEMLGRYPGVKPDPAKVDEYTGIYCAAWDHRFGEGK